MTTTHIPVRLTWHGWLTRERLAALATSRQGFTAQLVGQQPEVTFSVVASFPAGAAVRNGVSDAELELLLPDQFPDIVAALTAGQRLTLFSGPREVADCEVLSHKP